MDPLPRPPSPSPPRLRVAVCVATRGRPLPLARLLGALARQRELPAATELRVVVVDNDAQGSARAVCERAARGLALPLVYRVEARPGIPQARNAALAEAMPWADFVAFTDDDALPAPRWLAALLEAAQRWRADAVTGPIAMRFESPVPGWLAAAFELASDFAPGEARPSAYTGNALVRCASLAQLDEGFDEAMAASGGSDSELFRRFAGRGFRILWAPEARVEEQVPAARCRVGWVLRRAYRAGACDAYIRAKHAPGAATALALLAHGGYVLLRGGLGALLLPLAGRRRALGALALAAGGLGRLAAALGRRAREYA